MGTAFRGQFPNERPRPKERVLLRLFRSHASRIDVTQSHLQTRSVDALQAAGNMSLRVLNVTHHLLIETGREYGADRFKRYHFSENRSEFKKD